VKLDNVRPGRETRGQRCRNQLEIFNEANVPHFSQLARLSTEWAKVIGAMTVDWEGHEKTPPQMQPYLEEQDRSVRERAFRAMYRPYIEQRGVLADLFNRMYDIRVQVAKNAGFDNFRDYMHREKNRFDYTPDDCFRFHESVEVAVQPVVKRLMERRRKLLGIDRLRPWDIAVVPRVARLCDRTRTSTSSSTRPGSCSRMCIRISSELREDGRRRLARSPESQGKSPGAYCDWLPTKGLPLIFMNGVNVDDDVRTLLHESGHAFHVFETNRIPLIFQRHPGSRWRRWPRCRWSCSRVVRGPQARWLLLR
jgi:oligoendopeptidase F